MKVLPTALNTAGAPMSIANSTAARPVGPLVTRLFRTDTLGVGVMESGRMRSPVNVPLILLRLSTSESGAWVWIAVTPSMVLRSTFVVAPMLEYSPTPAGLLIRVPIRSVRRQHVYTPSPPLPDPPRRAPPFTVATLVPAVIEPPEANPAPAF